MKFLVSVLLLVFWLQGVADPTHAGDDDAPGAKPTPTPVPSSTPDAGARSDATDSKSIDDALAAAVAKGPQAGLALLQTYLDGLEKERKVIADAMSQRADGIADELSSRFEQLQDDFERASKAAAKLKESMKEKAEDFSVAAANRASDLKSQSIAAIDSLLRDVAGVTKAADEKRQAAATTIKETGDTWNKYDPTGLVQTAQKIALDYAGKPVDTAGSKLANTEAGAVLDLAAILMGGAGKTAPKGGGLGVGGAVKGSAAANVVVDAVDAVGLLPQALGGRGFGAGVVGYDELDQRAKDSSDMKPVRAAWEGFNHPVQTIAALPVASYEAGKALGGAVDSQNQSIARDAAAGKDKLLDYDPFSGMEAGAKYRQANGFIDAEKVALGRALDNPYNLVTDITDMSLALREQVKRNDAAGVYDDAGTGTKGFVEDIVLKPVASGSSLLDGTATIPGTNKTLPAINPSKWGAQWRATMPTWLGGN